MQDGLHQAADDLAQEIERTIKDGESFLENGPRFAPRSGKYQTSGGAVIPVEDIHDAL